MTLHCTICTREYWEDELGRQACKPCTRRADSLLTALAGPNGLYARLSTVLAPGSRNAGPAVSGSRTAPLPVRLEPLSLLARGGIITVLQSWLVDWHETLGWRHPRWEGDLQHQLDQAVAALRANLEWAASSHPAFDEFAGELARYTAACRAQVDDERPARRIGVTCPCGTVLRITIDTPGARCPGCETQYGHAEVLQLPMAERAAA
ncbi:hypothetical protein [Streptomyces yangpuensis]|uniref:hypothetical protein n=1 Tax=Streptomyces yangpuensis TaxID=1648182 RepID=UPI0035D8A089